MSQKYKLYQWDFFPENDETHAGTDELCQKLS